MKRSSTLQRSAASSGATLNNNTNVNHSCTEQEQHQLTLPQQQQQQQQQQQSHAENQINRGRNAVVRMLGTYINSLHRRDS